MKRNEGSKYRGPSFLGVLKSACVASVVLYNPRASAALRGSVKEEKPHQTYLTAHKHPEHNVGCVITSYHPKEAMDEVYPNLKQCKAIAKPLNWNYTHHDYFHSPDLKTAKIEKRKHHSHLPAASMNYVKNDNDGANCVVGVLREVINYDFVDRESLKRHCGVSTEGGTNSYNAKQKREL